MRKLILKMSVSADGFVGGPNGEMDWVFRSAGPDSTEWVRQTIIQAGLHIMGSRTFHDMAAYWPTSSNPLAAPMNDIPKVVFSKKGFVGQTNRALSTQAIKDAEKTDADESIQKTHLSKNASSWENVPVASDMVNDIAKLKQQDGKFILAHGGSGFAQDLVKYGLIDEYRLVVHPVILGKGLPLFASAPSPFDLKLESSTKFPTGIVAHIYTPMRR